MFLAVEPLAGAEGKGLTVEDYGSRPTGTMYLYGSIIQFEDKLRGTIYSNGNMRSGYRETFDYDLRFTSGQVVPPNFPTVSFFGVQRVLPLPLSFKEF